MNLTSIIDMIKNNKFISKKIEKKVDNIKLIPLEKSVSDIFDLTKGKRANIGDIRIWKNGKFQKTANGWVEIKENINNSQVKTNPEEKNKQIDISENDIDSKLIEEAKKYKSVEEFKARAFDEILLDLRGIVRSQIIVVPTNKVKIIWKDDYTSAKTTAKNNYNPETADPVDLIYDIKTDKYKLDDGHNRFVAAERNGKQVKGIITQIDGNIEELANLYKQEKGISIQEVWNKAHSKQIDILNNDIDSKLIEEAKKYDNVEEFIKAQGKIVYRGGNISDKIIGKGNLGSGVYVTTDKTQAISFSKDSGIFNEIVLPKGKYVKRGENITEKQITELNKKLQLGLETEDIYTQDFIDFYEGYITPTLEDGEITQTQLGKYMENITGKVGITDDYYGAIQYLIFNPKQIKTKSQLTDIWNKAHSEKKEKQEKPKDITETKEFKKWFGKSKVVDKEGKPLVVYHGTDKEFNEFNMNLGRKWASKVGIWFTDDNDFANNFGDIIIKGYVRIEKPLIISSDTFNDWREKYYNNEEWWANKKKEWIKDGYDGLIVKESYSNFAKHNIRNPQIITIFSPNQIKSVNNEGSFDSNNPNIYKSFYKLEDRLKWNGLDISIENKKGSIRSGIDKDGHKWETKMNYPYGYIRLTEAVDGDHLDCYLGEDEDSNKVFVVHQNDPITKKYDEDKVMLNFSNKSEAKEAYLKQYDRPGFFGSISELTIEDFINEVKNPKGGVKKIKKNDLVRKGLKGIIDLFKGKKYEEGHISKHADGTFWQKKNSEWKQIPNPYENKNHKDNIINVQEKKESNIEEIATGKFGTTLDFREAGYLLENGKMLDFSGKKEGGEPNQRSIDHREIENVYNDDSIENNYPELKKYGSYSIYMIDFINRGNIRMQLSGIEISKPLTNSQKNIITRHIKYNINDYYDVDIQDKNGNVIKSFSYEYPDVKAYKIFNDIDSYFNNNKSLQDIINLLKGKKFEEGHVSEHNDGTIWVKYQGEWHRDKRLEKNKKELQKDTEEKEFIINFIKSLKEEDYRPHVKLYNSHEPTEVVRIAMMYSLKDEPVIVKIKDMDNYYFASKGRIIPDFMMKIADKDPKYEIYELTLNTTNRLEEEYSEFRDKQYEEENKGKSLQDIIDLFKGKKYPPGTVSVWNKGEKKEKRVIKQIDNTWKEIPKTKQPKKEVFNERLTKQPKIETQEEIAKDYDEYDVNLMKKLGIPPTAYNIVVYNNHPKYLAKFDDKRGKTQYRYHKNVEKIAKEAKFSKLVKFCNVIPKIEKDITKLLKKPVFTKENVIGLGITLLNTIYLRVGTEEYAKENETYGLTTLLNSHLKFDNNKAILEFIGKKKVKQYKEISDPKISQLLKKYRELGIDTDNLLKYKQGEIIETINSYDINNYLSKFGGYTAKNFRSFHASRICAEILRDSKPTTDSKQMKKNITLAVEKTAEQLGHTPAVCKNSYIDPLVINAYENNLGWDKVPYLRKSIFGNNDKEFIQYLNWLKNLTNERDNENIVKSLADIINLINKGIIYEQPI